MYFIIHNAAIHCSKGIFDVCKWNVYFSCKCPHTKLQQSNHETENKKPTTLSQNDWTDNHVISYISDIDIPLCNRHVTEHHAYSGTVHNYADTFDPIQTLWKDSGPSNPVGEKIYYCLPSTISSSSLSLPPIIRITNSETIIIQRKYMKGSNFRDML